jgi:hypothetical protein
MISGRIVPHRGSVEFQRFAVDHVQGAEVAVCECSAENEGRAGTALRVGGVGWREEVGGKFCDVGLRRCL